MRMFLENPDAYPETEKRMRVLIQSADLTSIFPDFNQLTPFIQNATLFEFGTGLSKILEVETIIENDDAKDISQDFSKDTNTAITIEKPQALWMPEVPTKEEILAELQPDVEKLIKEKIKAEVQKVAFPDFIKSNQRTWESLKLIIDPVSHHIYFFFQDATNGGMTFSEAGLTVRGNPRNLSQQGRLLMWCAHKGDLLNKSKLGTQFSNPANIISRFNAVSSKTFDIPDNAIVNYSPLFYKARFQITEIKRRNM